MYLIIRTHHHEELSVFSVACRLERRLHRFQIGLRKCAEVAAECFFGRGRMMAKIGSSVITQSN